MAKIKSVMLSWEPVWTSGRTLEAKAGEMEITKEGGSIHLRIQNPRLRSRLGDHVEISPAGFLYVIYEDEPPPKK